MGAKPSSCKAPLQSKPALKGRPQVKGDVLATQEGIWTPLTPPLDLVRPWKQLQLAETGAFLSGSTKPNI